MKMPPPLGGLPTRLDIAGWLCRSQGIHLSHDMVAVSKKEPCEARLRGVAISLQDQDARMTAIDVGI